jgi:hypothetical protein
MNDAEKLNVKCKCDHTLRDHWEAERKDYKGCMMAGCFCEKFMEAPKDDNP